MMQAALSLLGGLLIGGGSIVVLGRRIDPRNPPVRASALAWTAIGFGLAALLMVASGLLMPLAAETFGFPMSSVPAMPASLSILFAVASFVAAVGAFAKHWPTWVGIVVGGLPVLFWIWFVVAEIVSPHA